MPCQCDGVCVRRLTLQIERHVASADVDVDVMSMSMSMSGLRTTACFCSTLAPLVPAVDYSANRQKFCRQQKVKCQMAERQRNQSRIRSAPHSIPPLLSGVELRRRTSVVKLHRTVQLAASIDCGGPRMYVGRVDEGWAALCISL